MDFLAPPISATFCLLKSQKVGYKGEIFRMREFVILVVACIVMILAADNIHRMTYKYYMLCKKSYLIILIVYMI